MSITEQVKGRITRLHGSQLFYLPTSMPGDPSIREMFVSRDIMDIVNEPWSENWMGQRHKEFRAKLDSFTRGDWFSVSENPFEKPSSTDIARVHPAKDEIWDIRCIDPNARIRCFGAFGGRNLFIALTWQYREDLNGLDEWEEEVNRCKAEWCRLFNPIQRYKGASVNEYLSNCTSF